MEPLPVVDWPDDEESYLVIEAGFRLLPKDVTGAAGAVLDELADIQGRLAAYVDQRVKDPRAKKEIVARLSALIDLIRAHQVPARQDPPIAYASARDLADKIKNRQPDIYKAHDDDAERPPIDPVLPDRG